MGQSFSFARSPIPCQDIDKSKVIPKEKVITILEKDVVFNELKKNWSEDIKIIVGSCLNDRGEIKIPGQHLNVLGRKCWVGDQLISFKIKKDKAYFRPLSTLRKTIPLMQYNKASFKKTLETIFSGPIVVNFFKGSDLCQVEFNSNPQELDMFLQLRDKSKNWCFLQSHIDGSELSVIKRLYAKDSLCSIDQ
ncbi:MAG: hypothetical protein K9K67_15075 [Bacteriovoracaceae bacterium]|nr:hypothetical protein [Bacteriovoracaceae bacterium]